MGPDWKMDCTFRDAYYKVQADCLRSRPHDNAEESLCTMTVCEAKRK